MKGFFLFLLFSLLFIGLFFSYHILNPSDTRYTRKGANWIIVPIDRNGTDSSAPSPKDP